MTYERQQLAIELERLLSGLALIKVAVVGLERHATSLLPDHPLATMLANELQDVAPDRHRVALIKALVDVIDGRAAKDAEGGER